jgi:hypothetical protein
VRLVHDHRKTLSGQRTDFSGDHRKFLQRGDDDGFPFFEGLLELLGRGVDVLHHPGGLLKLAHGALQLAVEDPTIGDHDDGVEDAAVGGVVQHRELVREPGDRVGLA